MVGGDGERGVLEAVTVAEREHGVDHLGGVARRYCVRARIVVELKRRVGSKVSLLSGALDADGHAGIFKC